MTAVVSVAADRVVLHRVPPVAQMVHRMMLLLLLVVHHHHRGGWCGRTTAGDIHLVHYRLERRHATIVGDDALPRVRRVMLFVEAARETARRLDAVRAEVVGVRFYFPVAREVTEGRRKRAEEKKGRVR